MTPNDDDRTTHTRLLKQLENTSRQLFWLIAARIRKKWLNDQLRP
jgi:hypothetical protein